MWEPGKKGGIDQSCAEGAPAPAAPRCLSSEALLGRSDELLISHRGDAYRLRLTRTGKLILTK